MAAEIPLSSIATVEMGESATAINRENQKNYITISASADGMSGGEAQKLVDQILAGYTFPDGCTYGYSGTLEMMNDAFSSLLTALVVAVLLVYMIMASQFESIRYPMIIMVSMPFGIYRCDFGSVPDRQHHHHDIHDGLYHAGRYGCKQWYRPHRLYQSAHGQRHAVL